MNVEEKVEDPTVSVIFLILYFASLIHVFMESRRMKESGLRNTLMVAVCFWPLAYVLWLFYWPGTLWRKLTGRKRLEPIFPFNFSSKRAD